MRLRRVGTDNKLSSIVIVSMLVAGGFIGFINLYSKDAHGTFVSGIIYDGSGGPWTIAGNPYIVVGDVTVPEGETLTIEPGVEVKFDGPWDIFVDGTLIAIGNETHRINITSNMLTPDISDWRHIEIHSTGYAEIKYCDISYAINGIRSLSSSNNIIAHNNIWNNAEGIYLFASSNNTISNNNISNNEIGITFRESSNNFMINNNITNHRIGNYLRDSSNITITNNNFYDDGIYIQGEKLSHFNSHNISNDNSVNDKPLYYYKDCTGITIDDLPVGELILANCTDFVVNNTQIDNTEIGIEVAYSTNISISNNTLSSLYLGGLLLDSSSNNRIVSNHISNSDDGIGIEQSSNNNIIADNNISSINYVGILIVASFNNMITNNKLSSCWMGIQIGGNWLDNSSNNIVLGNNFSENMWGIYVHGTSENEIACNNFSGNDGGIAFQSSSKNNIISNTISNNDRGCNFEGSKFNVISNNIITNNGDGIDIRNWSDNNVITTNIVSYNNKNGIYIYGSYYNNIAGNSISHNYKGMNFSQAVKYTEVRGNNISNNDYGLYIGWTFDNLIYHNSFINNTIQAYDETPNKNQWDNGYPSGGNYWSDFDESSEGAYDDYNGEGQNILGSDGIVDNGTIGGGGKNPYEIDVDAKDNYPLIEPYKNYMILKQGWNLISLPLIQVEQNLAEVLESIDGSYDAVQWYNITDARDPWKHYKVGKPYGNDLFELNEKMGFWIHITQPGDTIFFYNGTRPTENQTIPLHPGWNMVGYPSMSNRDRTTALNNITFGTHVDAIWTYNSARQRWEKIGSSDYFEVGRGYYIHAKSKCVWEVPR
ncbi:MAG: right-handed parallel beta-helix repeat-containing protein [Thermoplasmata archaeon]|nr:MAG: right-handed parallel beta-helix repeat-containing protein [Thermoplasmata archaeon]